jgi:NAD(P)-dependent dehydrogenase (short-subunit alcohol dehydrogenase family)
VQIRNSVVFVTGANRGLGTQLVKQLQARGAKTIYAASRSGKSELEGVVDVKLDITNPYQVRAALSRATDVNVLINNAGVNQMSPLINPIDDTHAQLEMEVNYFGTLRMCRAFAPVIATNGGGTIVNVASIAGRVNVPIMGSLSASKAAVVSMTQGIRAQLARQNITVITVMPGVIDTDMARFVPPPKADPALVAQKIVDAIETDCEDVYPDVMAEMMAQGLSADPKAIEKQVAALQ